MDFDLSIEQKQVVETALSVSEKYGPEYWREKDATESFPREFLKEIAELGFCGINLPEQYGGAGLGLTEMTLAMEALCRGGGGGGPCFGLLFSALGAESILAHGNDAQKEHYLPRIASGDYLAAFGLSEPDAGTNTLNMRSFAERHDDHYVVNGAKWFTTNLKDSQLIILLARTTRLESCERKTDGVSMFIVDLPDDGFHATAIPKHALNYYKSYSVSIEDLQVPVANVLGSEGQGFRQILATLNPERILVAAAAVGIGRLAIAKAVEYAGERRVFDVPIGAHQAVQHPLAAAHAKLETAWLGILKAAVLSDQKQSQKQIGDIANMSKYVAVEACLEATQSAMQTLGGAGFAREYDVERWFREVQLFRLAPITQQMTLNYLGEHVLGLPKSY